MLNSGLSTKPDPKIVKLYECNLCMKVLKSKWGYIYHMEDHKGIRYECETCGKTYSRQKTLDIHKNLHKTGPQTSYLPCDICQKMFASKSSLTLHTQVHKGTQKYTCSTCDARFSRKTDLERHETIHTGEKPYQCGLCHKSFRSQGDLGRHRKWHNGAFTCKYCGKSYARKNEIRLHEARHVTNGDAEDNDTSEYASKSHVCKICSANFVSELNLKNHMIFHERHIYRRFACTLCGETFSTSSNRVRHMQRYHTEPESVLKCDMCSKTFVIAWELKKHIKSVHLQHWAFPCEFCEKGFDRKKEYAQHMNSKHKHEKMNFPPPRAIRRHLDDPCSE